MIREACFFGLELLHQHCLNGVGLSTSLVIEGGLALITVHQVSISLAHRGYEFIDQDLPLHRLLLQISFLSGKHDWSSSLSDLSNS